MLELQGLFYARFHPERGPSVIEQVPKGLVATRRDLAQQSSAGVNDQTDERSCVDFSDISAYVIPPYDLCDKSISVRAGDCMVLGWPVSLESETYARNRFTFDVCLVLRELADDRDGSEDGASAELRVWEQIVKKTALSFKGLEVDDGLLSTEEDRMGKELKSAMAQGVLKEVYAQLKAYDEACVRVDKTHVLNLRLAQRAVPDGNQHGKTKVNAWDVPLLVRSLPSPDEWTYDLVLERIVPHLNGVNHIAKIAQLAAVDIKLVKRAIKGLLAHGKVQVLDLFHFQAVYALTQDFAWFVRDTAMQEECSRYVHTGHPHANAGAPRDSNDAAANQTPPPTHHLLTLYTTLATSPSIHDFVLANPTLLHAIDTRRLITFGILKGFLRRQHKYVLALANTNTSTTTPQQPKASTTTSGEDAARDFDRAWRKAALSSGWATPPPFEAGGSVKEEEEEGGEVSADDEKLMGYLDGRHCLDEVCVGMRMTEKTVLRRLREGRRVFGEVVVFCK